MPFPQSPPDKILKRIREIMVDAALGAAWGEPEFNIRHYRHRPTKITERPAAAPRMIDIAIDDSMGTSQWETAWRMQVDIVVDLELAPEDSPDDVTGWNAVAATANAYATLLINSNGLNGLVDDVMPGDQDPDEESKPDDGRLAAGVVVLYRTPNTDLNRLLGPEENVI